MSKAFELTLTLDGTVVGLIHIAPHESSIANLITGETNPITQSDKDILADIFERYLLAPAEKYISYKGGND
jgi:hypothetical protein